MNTLISTGPGGAIYMAGAAWWSPPPKGRPVPDGGVIGVGQTTDAGATIVKERVPMSMAERWSSR